MKGLPKGPVVVAGTLDRKTYDYWIGYGVAQPKFLDTSGPGASD